MPPPADGTAAETERALAELEEEWESVVDFEDGEAWYPQAERQAKVLGAPRL